MLPEEGLGTEEFEALAKWDERIAAAVAAERCVHCGGPLHVANYERKPRGGAIASAGEAFTLRHSLCCGRQGCRKRTLPPSLRFLGRRVYLEVVVVFVSLHAQAVGNLRAAREATHVPEWTLHRWLAWWREAVAQERWWAELRARFVPPPPCEAELPRSLIEKLAQAVDGAKQLGWLAARSLAPGTTRSPIDAARFVREVVGASASI
jgi:hypothetical protein